MPLVSVLYFQWQETLCKIKGCGYKWHTKKCVLPTKLEGDPKTVGDFKSWTWLTDTIKARVTDELYRLVIVAKNNERLKTNLQNPRKNKGVIDRWGKVLNWLFAAATTKELETVSKRIYRLFKESSAIAHELEAQTRKYGNDEGLPPNVRIFGQENTQFGAG